MATRSKRTPQEIAEARRRKKMRAQSVDLAWAFRQSNQDLSIAPSGMEIWFDPSGSLDGTLRMTVTIPEGLTGNQYRAAWDTIRAWRERLTATTGRGRAHGKEFLYQTLQEMKKSHSWSQLVAMMNDKITRCVQTILDAKTKEDASQAKIAFSLLTFYVDAFHVKKGDLFATEERSKPSQADIYKWCRQQDGSSRVSLLTIGHIRDRLR